MRPDISSQAEPAPGSIPVRKRKTRRFTITCFSASTTPMCTSPYVESTPISPWLSSPCARGVRRKRDRAFEKGGIDPAYLSGKGPEVHIHVQAPEGASDADSVRYLRKVQWPSMLHPAFERIRNSPKFPALLEPLIGTSLKQFIAEFTANTCQEDNPG